ncbi:polysaccharide deacetylase family protein [Actinophytocola oryzae]|uniref:Phosphotransferase family enzyme n=1 Tax=Actinophytocola oryzae TaxID=502181 RepID=A0A4R7W1Y6_9PSEU|nr:polysaccharide deacetylase family protein [Actinophytocola oryzae]TDV56442.1 phosphotransferase family enzyme [Actinophytocola oryzae]
MRTVCLTLGRLGAALDVGRGVRTRPDWNDSALLTGYPRILALLADLDITATFFVEGWSLLHYPAHVADLLERGHEVALHGWAHEKWSRLAPGEEERLLGDGLAALTSAGVTVPGFRAPHGVLSGQSSDLLAALGFRYDSSLLTEDDQPAGRLRPLRGDLVNIPFTWPMVDEWQYRRDRPPTPDQLATEWLYQVEHRTDELTTLVVHPHVSGVLDDRYAALERVLGALADDPDVRVCRAADLLAPRSEPGPPPVDAPPDRWIPYLRARGALAGPPWRWGPQETLAGGVSCEAVRVGDVVVKRPRELLAVAGHWPADRDRVLAEGVAMGRFPGLAPAVVDLDEPNLVLTMAFVGGEVWRDQLLAGIVDLDVVRATATALREVHATEPGELATADGARRFDELRLSPYFGGIDGTAEVVRRLRETTTHLIHGDYSPKNILVRRGGPDPDFTVLDWEVACAGDPVFDVAFLLTHLVAKSVHLPAHAEAFASGCAAFVDEYGELDEHWLATVLGALLLARVDGLSRLSYLDDRARAEIRGFARSMLDEGGPLPWHRR